MRRTTLAAVACLVLAGACSSGDPTDSAQPTALETSVPSTTSSAPSSTEAVATAVPATEQPTSTTPPSTVAPGRSPGSPGAGDSLYPEMGNGGYDVVHYELDLTINVDSNSLAGETTITSQATQELTAFNLDLAGLIVESILVDGVDSDFSRTGNELTVAPATPIQPGATFETTVSYGGVPEPFDDPADPITDVGWHNEQGYVFTASKPSGAMTFFPSNNHPTDKATFRFRLTTDSALSSLATGVLVDTIKNGATTTTVWEMTDPMATYAAAVYVGDFERRQAVGPNGLVIRNYFPPARADALEQAFAPTSDIISYFADLFGAPYPYDTYGSVVMPFEIGVAFENQTMSLHGTDTADLYSIAHEVMHQWAGNSVTVSDWQDAWMLEGFATYLPLMYLADRGLEAPLDPEAIFFLLDGKAYDGPAEVDVRDLFGESVYFRGALSLHALRVEVGDEVFRNILQAYYAQFQGGDASTEGFEAIVTELGGVAAGVTLNVWLYGGDLPEFPGNVPTP